MTAILRLWSSKKATIDTLGQFLGPVEDMIKELQPLIDAAPYLNIEFQSLTYIQAIYAFSGTFPATPNW